MLCVKFGKNQLHGFRGDVIWKCWRMMDGTMDAYLYKYSSVFRENRCPPPPKPVYGGNFSPEAVTLKIRSGSSKSNKLLILFSFLSCPNVLSMQIWLKSASWFMRYCAHKNLLAQIWQFKSCTDLEKYVKVTKIKSALQHVPMLYTCKSGWNPSTSSWDMVHTSTFGLKFGSLSLNCGGTILAYTAKMYTA